MHHGFLSIVRMIETDLEFEKDAVRIYNEFAEKVSDPQLKEVFKSLLKRKRDT